MFHSKVTGIDLHAPSNQKVFNGHTSHIEKGTVVKTIGVTEDGTPIVVPVSLEADIPFGVVWEGIFAQNLGLACVLGIFPFDTTGHVINDRVRFDNNGKIALTLTDSFVIGKVLGEGFIYLNLAAIDTGAFDWDVRGNSFIDDNAKLGSLTNHDVTVITDGQTRVRYTKNGQERHGDDNVVQDFRYQHSNNIPHHTGVLLDCFSATNSTAGNLVIWTHDIPEFTLQTFNVHLIAKKGNKKAIFDYTVTVSREDGLVVLHHVQTDYQVKIGTPSFKPKFSVNLTTFRIEVGNTLDADTIWSGFVQSHASF